MVVLSAEVKTGEAAVQTAETVEPSVMGYL